MIERVVILGGGSSGLLAALAFKTHLPQLSVVLVHSPEIGVIGVGEGSQPDLLNHLHGWLGIDPAWFLQRTRSTYKLGVRFLWGPRDHFFYSFSSAIATTVQGMPRPAGFYAFDDMSAIDPATALMESGKGFTRQSNGAPYVRNWAAYHVENREFAKTLSAVAGERGVEFVEGAVASAERSEHGLAAVK